MLYLSIFFSYPWLITWKVEDSILFDTKIEHVFYSSDFVLTDAVLGRYAVCQRRML